MVEELGLSLELALVLQLPYPSLVEAMVLAKGIESIGKRPSGQSGQERTKMLK